MIVSIILTMQYPYGDQRIDPEALQNHSLKGIQ